MTTRALAAGQTAEPIDETTPDVVHRAKERRCLTCQSVFASEWNGERICRRCKTKSGWRGGFRFAPGQGR